MSTNIGETRDGQYMLTQYSTGEERALQITDKFFNNYPNTGYIRGISREQAKEIAQLLLNWSNN